MPSALQRLAGVLLLSVIVLPTLASGGCSRPDTPAPPPLPSPTKVDRDIVQLAFEQCFSGDCERAHAHLAEVAAGSPVRREAEYRAIQYRFDADRLLRADVEEDLAQRRAVYQAITDSPLTEPALRLGAAERIARLGATSLSHGQEVALNAHGDAGNPAMAEAAELLKQSRSKDLSDQTHVRAVLEPRMFSGKASAEDIAMLRTVCKAQADAACLRQLDRLILH
jgi:hypothetical protein